MPNPLPPLNPLEVLHLLESWFHELGLIGITVEPRRTRSHWNHSRTKTRPHNNQVLFLKIYFIIFFYDTNKGLSSNLNQGVTLISKKLSYYEAMSRFYCDSHQTESVGSQLYICHPSYSCNRTAAYLHVAIAPYYLVHTSLYFLISLPKI